jgi:hypothetical protein
VRRRVDAADTDRQPDRLLAKEKEAQDMDGIGDVEFPVIVRVTGLLAGNVRVSEEQVAENRDGIADVRDAIRVRIPTDEHLVSAYQSFTHSQTFPDMS